MTSAINSAREDGQQLLGDENSQREISKWGRIVKGTLAATAAGAAMGLVTSSLYHAPAAVGQSIVTGVAIGALSSATGALAGSALQIYVKDNGTSRVLRALGAAAGSAALIDSVIISSSQKFIGDPSILLWAQGAFCGGFGALSAVVSGCMPVKSGGNVVATLLASTGIGSLSGVGLGLAVKTWIAPAINMPLLGELAVTYGITGMSAIGSIFFSGCLERKET